MSWRRSQWQRAEMKNSLSHIGEMFQHVPNPEAFSLIRRVDLQAAPRLATLIHDALEKSGINDKRSVVNRSAQDGMLALTLLSKPAMLRLPASSIPADRDKYLASLATNTGTSHRKLESIAMRCGFFGKLRNGAVTLGFTFEDDTTELINNERSAAVELVQPGASNSAAIIGYPHVNLGMVSVTSAERGPLRKAATELIQQLGEITLMPVQAGRGK